MTGPATGIPAFALITFEAATASSDAWRMLLITNCALAAFRSMARALFCAASNTACSAANAALASSRLDASPCFFNSLSVSTSCSRLAIRSWLAWINRFCCSSCALTASAFICAMELNTLPNDCRIKSACSSLRPRDVSSLPFTLSKMLSSASSWLLAIARSCCPEMRSENAWMLFSTSFWLFSDNSASPLRNSASIALKMTLKSSSKDSGNSTPAFWAANFKSVMNAATSFVACSRSNNSF